MSGVATVSGGNGAAVSNATRYSPLAVVALSWSISEALSEVACHFGGTLSKFGVRVSANSATATSTCRIRKNQANSGISLTVAAGTTGAFEDNTNTATYSSGDTLAWQLVGASGGSGITAASYTVVNTPSSNATTKIGYTTGGAATLFTASVVRNQVFAGFVSSLEATNVRQTNINFAGTAKNMGVVVGTNSRTANTTVRLRKNNANANSVVTLTALTTGLFEDTTNTDSIAANDDLAWQTTTGAGTSESQSIFQCTVEYENSTNAKSNLIAGTGTNNPSNVNSALTRYFPLAGRLLIATVESEQQVDLNLAATLSDLAVLVITNTVNGSSTFKSRKNGADGNMLVTYGASTTGAIEDNTNTDSIANGDTVDYQLVTGGSSGTISTLVVGCVSAEAGGATVTGAAAITGAGEVSATGTRKAVAAGAVAGVGTVAAAGTRTAITAATVGGAGTVAATGTRSAIAAASAAGAGTVSATGSRAASATVAVNGTGTVAATGARTTSGQAAVAGAGSISASGLVGTVVTGAAAVAGAGSVSAAGHRRLTGTVALAGAGAIVAAAVRAARGQAAVAGTGTTSAQGLRTAVTAAGLVGVGAVGASGYASRPGAATVAGAGVISATGRIVSPEGAWEWYRGPIDIQGLELKSTISLTR